MVVLGRLFGALWWLLSSLFVFFVPAPVRQALEPVATGVLVRLASATTGRLSRLILDRRAVRRVLLVGDAGVGKTQIVRRVRGDGFQSQDRPTIVPEFDVVCMLTPSTPPLTAVQLWDMPGGKLYRELGVFFWRSADALLLVFDLTRPETLESIQKTWIPLVRQHVGDRVDTMPRILVGCKADLTKERKVVRAEAKSWATAHGATYLEISTRSSAKDALAAVRWATAT